MTRRLPALVILATALGLLGGAATLWWARLGPDEISLVPSPPAVSLEAGITRQDRRDRHVAMAR